MKHNVWGVAALGVALVWSALAPASTIWVGNDTSTEVYRYTSSGTFIGPWGASGATGSAIDSAGGYAYTVQPGQFDSVITKYNASQTPVGVIHFTTGIENGNGFPSWIEDMAYGGANTLWVSGYNGIVYHLDSGGNVLGTPFDTGHTYPGIATDGTYLYTTRGFSGDIIDVRDLSGNIVGGIDTSAAGGYRGGIGYDASDNTLWVGDEGVIRHFDLAGNQLGFFTGTGNYHDGLEVGDLTAVPEPATLALCGIGGLSLLGYRWRRSRKA